MNKEIGILFLFFNKLETTEKVFSRILEAKPHKLFLAQDGAREGNNFDLKNIPECRERVEALLSKIDWDCTIYRNYAVKNMGCDPREYDAISWAFGEVDKLIIIEDDCICSHSFFTFMDELLSRFENDERIAMISGMEKLGRNSFCKNSYYFTQANSGCAWGTWKRTWEDVLRISKNYQYIEDKSFVENLEMYVKKTGIKAIQNYVQMTREHKSNNEKENKICSWEFALSTAMVLESRLAINPVVNLVKNIGVVPGATHSGDDIRTMPKRVRKIFELEAEELEFPLSHPEYVIRDMRYEEKFDKHYSFSKWEAFCDRIERVFLLIRYRGMKSIIKIMRRTR